MSIKKKLAYFLLIIILLPLSLLSFFSYREAKDGLIELAFKQLSSDAHSANDLLRSVIEFELRNDESLLRSPELLSSLAENKLINHNITDGSYVFVIDHTARVLIHPSREKKENLFNYTKTNNPSQHDLARLMTKGLEGKSSFTDSNGQEMLVYYVPYSSGKVITASSILNAKYDLGWSLAVATPKKFVLQKANKILIISLVISIISFIFFACLGFYLIHSSIVGPVMALSKYMIKLGDEFNIHERISTGNTDEIGTLYSGFNKMIDKIHLDKEQLSDLQLYLENIINSMPSIIISVNKELKVSLWNRQAEALTGLTALCVKNNDVSEILERYKIFNETIQSSINNNIIESDRVILNQEDGLETIYDFTIYPLISEYDRGAVIRIDDVTDKVKFEQMMIQTEKMMSLGGLAAGMAHEINNPIGSMVQGSQIIKRRLDMELELNSKVANECGLDHKAFKYYLQTREIIKFIDGIREAGHRASRIVADMLDFSRRSNEHKKMVRLNELVNTSIALASNDYDLKKNFDFKNIKIERELSDDIKFINCIENEIEQVLLNIIKNAAQAIGYSDIRENWQPTIAIKTYLLDNYACIEIKDNGSGISPDKMKRIFEPFYTTKPVGVGTGLGLSVSYFIIKENHDGEIRVTSELNQGTTFTIKLPL